MRRPLFSGIRLRLALALLIVVAGALGVVYLIVVPSLESELISNKLSQLEEDAQTVGRNYASQIGNEQEFADGAASLFQARVVVYSILQNQPFIFGDSNTTSSLDVARDPIALRATRSRQLERGTVERGNSRFAEVAVPLQKDGIVILLSDSLNDPIASLNLIERRLLFAGLLALLFAVVVGYAAASLHARRIRRLERAADRIAGGRFDEPVVDKGNDELGDLATAFERMRVRLEKLDRARSEFIANASHELRTPLFSLGGFLELMADEELDEATRQEFLETMREQVDRLAKLATDLLDLSRLDAGQMRVEHEPVDLGEVARVVTEEFSALAERKQHTAGDGRRGTSGGPRRRVAGASGRADAAGQRPHAHAAGNARGPACVGRSRARVPGGRGRRAGDRARAHAARLRSFLPRRGLGRLGQRARARDHTRARRDDGRHGAAGVAAGADGRPGRARGGADFPAGARAGLVRFHVKTGPRRFHVKTPGPSLQ